MTQKQVQTKIESHREFIKYVVKIFNEYICIENGRVDNDGAFKKGTSYLDDGSIHFYNDEVLGSGDEYWNYGGHEFHSYSMPISFLWEEDANEKFLEGRIKAHADKLAAKIQKAKEDEENRKAAKEAYDIAEFERLSQKFGVKKP